ncbi:hypothetical protein AXK58_10315 [Tsukamurella tyrosinosolvens]|nr:hypothetical protein AXK58_10315 [Tsukamurella tyrosinosolvens]
MITARRWRSAHCGDGAHRARAITATTLPAVMVTRPAAVGRRTPPSSAAPQARKRARAMPGEGARAASGLRTGRQRARMTSATATTAVPARRGHVATKCPHVWYAVEKVTTAPTRSRAVHTRIPRRRSRGRWGSPMPSSTIAIGRQMLKATWIARTKTVHVAPMPSPGRKPWSSRCASA